MACIREHILHYWITHHWPPAGLHQMQHLQSISTMPMPLTPQNQPAAQDYHSSQIHRYNKHMPL
jgi:hypothetical protein